MTAKVLVLGLGSIGLRHCRSLLALGAETTGFDPSAIQQSKAGDIGVAVAISRDVGMEHADAVVVASPSQHHFQDLKESVARGKPVFIEKPLASSLDGLDDLVKGATAPIFPALVLRHDPSVKAARAFLSRAAAGTEISGSIVCESYLPDWRPNADYTQGYAADPVHGGVLLDHIHEVDLAWHLLGPLKLQAAKAFNSGRLKLESEERVEMTARHSSGMVTIAVDYAHAGPPRRETELKGGWGTLKLDILARRIQIRDASGRTIEDKVLPGVYDDDYVDQMKLFLDVVKGAAQPSCTVGEALDVLRFTLQARKACGLPGR